MQFYILNRELKMLASVSTSAPDSLFIKNDKQVINATTFLSTYDFDVHKGHDDYKHLSPGGYIVFMDKHSKYRLYTIMSIEADSQWASVHCENIGFDMINECMEQFSMPSTTTLREYCNMILPGANIWINKTVSETLLTSTNAVSTDGIKTKLEVWQIIMTKFNCECDFTISLLQDNNDNMDYNNSIGAYIQQIDVDIWTKGSKRPKQSLLENELDMKNNGEKVSGKIQHKYVNYYDLKTVKEKVDITNLCNAVIVDFGKVKPGSDEEKLRAQFENAEWSENGIIKKRESHFIYDENSYSTWERYKAKTMPFFNSQISTEEDEADTGPGDYPDNYICARFKPTSTTDRGIYDEVISYINAHNKPEFTYTVELNQDYVGTFGSDNTFAEPGSWVQIVWYDFKPAISNNNPYYSNVNNSGGPLGISAQSEHLCLQARIDTVTYCYTEEGKDTCTLTNTEPVTNGVITNNYYGTAVIESTGGTNPILGPGQTCNLTARLLDENGDNVKNFSCAWKRIKFDGTEELDVSTAKTITISYSGDGSAFEAGYTYYLEINISQEEKDVSKVTKVAQIDIQKLESVMLQHVITFDEKEEMQLRIEKQEQEIADLKLAVATLIGGQ